MPRVTPILTTFNGGEMSALLYGRVDFKKYPNSCRLLENMIPLAQGPATRRTGTRYVSDTRNHLAAWLLPFEFSTVQAYVIEATDQKFRFFKDRGRIESPPGTPIEVATPYLEADLPALRWAQAEDTMYLVQAGHQIRKLTRSSHTAWTLSTVQLLDGPYLDEKVNLTITPSAASGSVTLLASAALWSAADVGRSVRLKHGSTWSWFIVTAYTDTTHVTADVKAIGTGAATTSATASAAYRLGAFYSGNWPQLVAFYEERLLFAATSAQPRTIFASRVGLFEEFSPSKADGTVEDDYAYTFTLTEGGVNALRWMSAGQTLAVGSSDREVILRASSLDEAITPTNVTARSQSTRGSAAHIPVRVDDQVLYIAKARRRLYEFAYNFEADRYRSPDMTLLATHLAQPKLKGLVWQGDPFGMVWAWRDDGVLLGFTYLRDQDVTAWHRHPLAGTDVKVLSAAVIPGDGEDELWLVVERTIDGATRRFVEVLTYAFAPDNATDLEYGVFVDASLQLDNAIALELTPGAGATVRGTTGVVFTSGGAAFVVGDVGREIRRRYLDAATGTFKWARAQITGYTSATQVAAKILSAFPSTAAIAAGGWHLTVTTITGLSHLEGQTVQILADGATHPDRVVAAGAIALARPVAIAQVGLGYASRIETMNLEAGAADGTAQTRQQRIHQLGILFVDTVGARFGSSAEDLETIPFRSGADAMDAPPPLFTGTKRVAFPKGYDDGVRIRIEQLQPLPLTVAALVPRVVTND